MINTTIKKRDTSSNSSDTRMTRMKIIVSSALLLTASSAFADITFFSGSNVYTDPELAQVDIQNLGDETFRVHSSGITDDLIIEGPSKYELPETANGKLSVTQQLDLVVNLSLGVVEGTARGYILSLPNNENLSFRADVQGHVTCLPLNGRECGQLVLDLELQGVLSDPSDPSKVGQVITVMLGSLVWDDTNGAHWAAISANTTIGGNEGLITSLSWIDFNQDGS